MKRETETNKDFENVQLAIEKERISKSNNHFETLGISRDSSIIEIKQKYKKLCLLFHPDKREGLIENEYFQKIKTAHDILIHPEEREFYEKQLDSNKINPNSTSKYPFNTQESPCGSCHKPVNLYSSPFPFFCPHCKGMTNLFPPPNYSHTTYSFGSSTLAYQATEVELTPIYPAFVPRRKRGRIPKNLKQEDINSNSEKKQKNSTPKKERKKRKNKRKKETEGVETEKGEDEKPTVQREEHPRKAKQKKVLNLKKENLGEETSNLHSSEGENLLD